MNFLDIHRGAGTQHQTPIISSWSHATQNPIEKTISELDRSSLGVQVELPQASSFVGNYSCSLGASGFVPDSSRWWTSSRFRGNALQNISTVWRGLFLCQVNLGATPQPQKSFTNWLICITRWFGLALRLGFGLGFPEYVQNCWYSWIWLSMLWRLYSVTEVCVSVRVICIYMEPSLDTLPVLLGGSMVVHSGGAELSFKWGLRSYIPH